MGLIVDFRRIFKVAVRQLGQKIYKILDFCEIGIERGRPVARASLL